MNKHTVSVTTENKGAPVLQLIYSVRNVDLIMVHLINRHDSAGPSFARGTIRHTQSETEGLEALGTFRERARVEIAFDHTFDTYQVG